MANQNDVSTGATAPAHHSTADRELLLTRILDAPRELVWEVWTNPEHIAQWWGPNGFTTTIYEMDMRPGGTWDLVMHGPDGVDYKNESIFREVIEHERIVYEHTSSPKFTATITFFADGDKTILSWHMLFESADEFQYTCKTFKADEGLRQNVVKLAAFLEKMKAHK